MTKKIILGLIIAYVIMFIAQLIFIKYENPAILNEPAWDSRDTKTTFMRACGDCHSNETVFPWYSKIPPVSFFLYNHISEGRENFNISEYRREDGVKAAYEFKKGEMPLRAYTLIHKDAVIEGQAKVNFIRGLEATFGKYTKEKLEKNAYNHPEE